MEQFRAGDVMRLAYKKRHAYFKSLLQVRSDREKKLKLNLLCASFTLCLSLSLFGWMPRSASTAKKEREREKKGSENSSYYNVVEVVAATIRGRVKVQRSMSSFKIKYKKLIKLYMNRPIVLHRRDLWPLLTSLLSNGVVDSIATE